MRTRLVVALLALLGTTASAQQFGWPGGRPGGRNRPPPAPQAPRRPGDVIDSVARPRPGGPARRLTGRITLTGADADALLADFRHDYGDWFDIAPDTTLRVGTDRRTLGGRTLRFEQTVHGYPVEGHGLVLQLDNRGQARSVHGVVSEAVRRMPAPLVGPVAAIDIALSAGGLSLGDLRGDPLVRSLARIEASGARLVHRVEVVRGLIPLALEVDAHDGSLIRVVENSVHGGTLNYDGVDLPFATGSAKGRAYRSLGQATAAVAQPSTLGHVTRDDVVPGLADVGTLTGRFAQVIDSGGAQIFSPINNFAFDHLDPTPVGSLAEYQLFDHVNTYSWLTRMGSFVLKRMGPFAGDTTALAFVNYDDDGAGYVNAFYSAGDPDGVGGYAPGFFVFGEFTVQTGDPMDDMSRDPSVVCHEYFHLVVDKQGVDLGATPIDTPPRAVNEALADYAAASLLKDPRIGRAFVTHGTDIGTSGEALRDLSEERTLADDLWAVVGETGLPEEHTAGHVFGAALWRARSVLKPVLTDRTVFGGLDGLPLGTAEVGFPVVTPANATDAYHAYFFAAYEALADGLLEQGNKGRVAAGKLLGAFLAHGITGSRADNVRVVDTDGGRKLVTSSAFLDGDLEHLIDLELLEGQTLKVAVRGIGGTTVDFAFDDAPSVGDAPGDFAYAAPKKVNPLGTKATQPKIGVNVSRVYRLTITNSDGQGGAYKLLVLVK